MTRHSRAAVPARVGRRVRVGAWVGAGVGTLALLTAAGSGWRSAVADPPRLAELGEVTVYKSPTCECCHRWVEHMREAGFAVTTRDVVDVSAVKREQGIPGSLVSCHTSVSGGYAIEGHVPADEVRRLLTERPAVAGLAVPGMPAGSPGMEVGRSERYQVLSFTPDGASAVYAER